MEFVNKFKNYVECIRNRVLVIDFFFVLCLLEYGWVSIRKEYRIYCVL